MARVRLKYFLCALVALGEALIRCWAVILLALTPPLILALSGQGREALFITMGGLGFRAWMLTAPGILLSVIYACLVLESGVLRARPNRARLYARHTAPQLFAVMSFALPLALHYAGSKISVGFFFQLLQFGGPMMALAVPAMLVSDGRWPLTMAEITPLALIGLVYAATFVFTDETSVLTRFLVLTIAIVSINWFLPRSYLRNQQTHYGRLRLTALILLVFPVLLLWLAGWISADPADRAPWWGPMNIILIATLAWMSLGYILELALWGLSHVRWCARNSLWLRALRLGVLGLMAWRLLWGPFNEEAVRMTAPVAEPPSQTLSAYLDQWLIARQNEASKANLYPIFIVTAEGGGIRAAYWTATVLAALQDQRPKFAEHVLALSGVSGGSVGTSIFAALAHRPAAGAMPPCRQAGGFEACAQRIGRGDLLSAPLASMLLSEPFHRLTTAFTGADRAAELERSLERAWRDAIGNNRFSEPFHNIAVGERLLLPNATSAGTGKRLVITAFDSQAAFDPARALDGRALSLSTATLLSARFPAFSPAGLYQESADRWIRIVDGGYADNSGAATGADVFGALVAALERTRLQERFLPVVIAIANSAQTDQDNEPRSGFRALTIGALLDPVLTLDSIRAGVSKSFEAALRGRVVAEGGIFLGELRLPHRGVELPLGWMLAPQTADLIDQLRQELAADPNGDFQRIVMLLSATKDEKK